MAMKSIERQKSDSPKPIRKVIRKNVDSARYSVPVVRSTFQILEELSSANELNLHELTVRTQIPKSTVFRILATLTTMGYVIRDSDRGYMLSRKLGDLASDSAEIEVLRRAALPSMMQLRDTHGETVNLGILQFGKVVYLEVVPSEFALRLHERRGAMIHAHASAIGKAILAFSPHEVMESLLQAHPLQKLTANTITSSASFTAEIRKVRKSGVAYDREETSPLASCVGVPILDSNGVAIAALSISGPTSRFQPKNDSAVVRDLRKKAVEISKALGE